MKKLTLFIAMLAISVLAIGQIQQQFPLIKKIEVTGSAEREILPDEIYVRIALKEYKRENKIMRIDQLESQLVKAVNQQGISNENLRVENIYGYNWDWRKKRSDDFLATKSFRLKVSDVKKVNDLVEKLDPEGINSISIAEITHSKIEEIKYELKLEALKKAKEKARYLLNGIDEELGGALEIQEIDYGYPQPMYETAQFARAKGAVQDESYQSNLEIKNITLKADLRVVFEIE